MHVYQHWSFDYNSRSLYLKWYWFPYDDPCKSAACRSITSSKETYIIYYLLSHVRKRSLSNLESIAVADEQFRSEDTYTRVWGHVRKSAFSSGKKIPENISFALLCPFLGEIKIFSSFPETQTQFLREKNIFFSICLKKKSSCSETEISVS